MQHTFIYFCLLCSWYYVKAGRKSQPAKCLPLQKLTVGGATHTMNANTIC